MLSQAWGLSTAHGTVPEGIFSSQRRGKRWEILPRSRQSRTLKEEVRTKPESEPVAQMAIGIAEASSRDSRFTLRESGPSVGSKHSATRWGRPSSENVLVKWNGSNLTKMCVTAPSQNDPRRPLFYFSSFHYDFLLIILYNFLKSPH